MRKPAHQAAFFKLLAQVLCYLVTGNNDCGYLSKAEWNPYYRVVTGFNVPTYPPLYLAFSLANLILPPSFHN